MKITLNENVKGFVEFLTSSGLNCFLDRLISARRVNAFTWIIKIKGE